MPVEYYGYAIYSNDGSTTFVNPTPTAIPLLDVGDNSVISGGDTVYTYTGTKTFKGLATTPNATVPVYVSGDHITLTVYALDKFYIVEGDPTPTDAVTIEYNGITIAALKAGQSASLPCKDKPMLTDLVVTVPEGMGGGDTPADGEEWIGDGNTHIWVSLTDGRTSPMLGVGVNGTVTVDWGDGTTPDVLTGTSTSTVKWTPTHNYAAAGDYVITLTVVGSIEFIGTGSASALLGFSSVWDLRSYAYLSAINKIEMGNGTGIGKYAFSSLGFLASINIPNSVRSIGNSAFRNCASLKGATIPDSVTSIGDYAFYYCHKLASINIPDGVTSIGSYAFQNCYSLTSIKLPDSVTSIGDYAFSCCYSLESITIPNSVTSIGARAFQNCTRMSSINIPNSVRSIGIYAFQGCSTMASVSIPYGVTTISEGLVRSNYILESINIPDSVTSIDTYAFDHCRRLSFIRIPSSVTNIGQFVFQYCQGLAKIRFERKTPPSVYLSNAFTNLPTDCVISVPVGSLNAYKTAANYPDPSTYTYIEE